MFAPIEIPSGCVMLSNVVDLKDCVTVEDVELVPGQACKYPGFISGEGSIGEPPAGDEVAAGLRQGVPEQAGGARAGMP